MISRTLTHTARHAFWLLSFATLVVSGCGSDHLASPSPDPVPAPPENPGPSPTPIELNGAWRALYWIAETPSGAVFDVITAGGSINLQVSGDTVTGSMHVPENITNGAPQTVSMVGRVHIAGDSVRFEQTNDTFVQRAVWKHHPGVVFDALAIVNHHVQGARFTVVLVRNW
jgi:hypothetical protein